MNDKNYRSWKKARAEARVPEDFLQRVMASVAETQNRSAAALVWTYLLAMATSRSGRVAACSLAGAAYLIRVGFFLSPFVAY